MERFWRVAFVAAGVFVFVGGGMHPSAPAELSVQEQWATMMADDAWVPGHTLVAIGTVLLLLGFVGVRRAGAWPSVASLLPVVIVVTAAYAVETVVHTAAVVDEERLALGEWGLVSLTHLVLSLVLYPLFGITMAYLAVRLAASWTVPQRVLAGAGIIGGICHALSVPLAVLLTDVEVSFLFAAAGILLSAWSVSLGLIGVRSRSTPEAELLGATQ